jgi:hypothetical protein
MGSENIHNNNFTYYKRTQHLYTKQYFIVL